MIEERVFKSESKYPIHYRFKAASRDCNHLLVVMSGFNLPDPTAYDFSQALLYCDSHILWIKDDFDGLPAYYLCNKMSFEIEENVSQLITGVIAFLKPAKTSILGASKGGSMALYYGIKQNLDHVISVVPQFYIGSYVAQDTPWERVGKMMMGEINEAKIELLNIKMAETIGSANKTSQHIYLFTSPADYQYTQEILPNLDLFSRFKHFNLIVSKSRFITEHNQVANYNIKVILSLIYQFEHGITPHWGMIHNGGDWAA